jgi:prevent-host-death family protein
MGMTSEIPVTQAREELADLINRVAYGHERIVLTRHSRPVACIVPPDDLARLEKLEREDEEVREGDAQPGASLGYIGLATSGDAAAPGAAGFPVSPGTPGAMPIAARHQENPRG